MSNTKNTEILTKMGFAISATVMGAGAFILAVGLLAPSNPLAFVGLIACVVGSFTMYRLSEVR